MSRAQGVRRFTATQTGTPRIAGNLRPELGARGLRGEKARYGATSRTTLIAIGHQP